MHEQGKRTFQINYFKFPAFTIFINTNDIHINSHMKSKANKIHDNNMALQCTQTTHFAYFSVIFDSRLSVSKKQNIKPEIQAQSQPSNSKNIPFNLNNNNNIQS